MPTNLMLLMANSNINTVKGDKKKAVPSALLTFFKFWRRRENLRNVDFPSIQLWIIPVHLKKKLLIKLIKCKIGLLIACLLLLLIFFTFSPLILIIIGEKIKTFSRLGTYAVCSFSELVIFDTISFNKD